MMKVIRRSFFMRKVEEIMQVNSLNQRIGKIPIDKMSKENDFLLLQRHSY